MPDAPSVDRYARVLSYDEAYEIVTAGLRAAQSAGIAMTVVVIDSTQAPLALGRESGASPFTAEVALSKARTSFLLRMPTDALTAATQPGGDLWGLSTATDTRIATFGGGIPLECDGLVVGAIGVSGGTARDDVVVATAASERFNALIGMEATP